jgi:filamentous hemagglutinin family protein
MGATMPRDRDAHRLGALLAAAALVWPVVASAEVATDGTLGRWVRLTGPDVEVGADLGRVRGRNLFHSFRRFGVEAGGRVTFTGPGGLDNVVSRVTGGEASRIDGTLASRVGRADVWLVNPSGIVFGPGARLDVPGSFHASTADEVRFEDGAAFSAIEPEGSTLSVARPEAFGFLGGKPGAITVDRGVLEVSEGEALSLVGGDIRILGDLIGDPRVLPEEERRNGVLRAPEGTITLAALATLGDVLIDGLDERVSGTATVRMSDHALLSASGNGGGVIRVYSGRLLLEDRSAIVSNNLAMRDALGGIDIRADEIELLRGGEISSDTSGEGTGGAINIAAKRLLIDANGAESLNQPLDIGDPDTPFIVRIFFGNSLIRTSSGRFDLDEMVASSAPLLTRLAMRAT